MGLRFRRSVRLFPGVRLNFSRSGISTTVGGRGATVTIGARGTYANVGLPGSGLSYRTRISPSQSKQHRQNGKPVDDLQSPTTQLSEFREIQSAEVSTLTSPGLNAIKELIIEAEYQRRSLLLDVQKNKNELSKNIFYLKISRLLIIRLYAQRFDAGIVNKCEESSRILEESRDNLDGCYVEVDFSLDENAINSYNDLEKSFSSLLLSEKIWDITAARTTNRVAERTAATQQLKRQPVVFDYVSSSIVKSKYQVLRLGNANGRTVQIFPGFIMMMEKNGQFALIEYRELDLSFGPSHFIETERVPRDSQVISHTWTKANKDGSPDKRFKNNRRIPIVQYGSILMKSPTGLLEQYEFSNYAASEAFARALNKHQETLSNLVTDQKQLPLAASEDADAGSPDESELHSDGESRFARKSEPNFKLDWAALALLTAPLVYVLASGILLH